MSSPLTLQDRIASLPFDIGSEGQSNAALARELKKDAMITDLCLEAQREKEKNERLQKEKEAVEQKSESSHGEISLLKIQNEQLQSQMEALSKKFELMSQRVEAKDELFKKSEEKAEKVEERCGQLSTEKQEGIKERAELTEEIYAKVLKIEENNNLMLEINELRGELDQLRVEEKKYTEAGGILSLGMGFGAFIAAGPAGFVAGTLIGAAAAKVNGDEREREIKERIQWLEQEIQSLEGELQ